MGTWMGTKSTWSNRMVRGVILWNMISRARKLTIDLLGQIGLTLLTWDETKSWPNVAIPLVQNTWNYFDVTLTDTWTSFFFLRSSLQSPGRWTTAGEVFPVRQLGQLEINFDKNESLSGELQDAIKRLSTGIPRSSTTYSMNYRPIIKVTRNLITSIINRGHPSYTY